MMKRQNSSKKFIEFIFFEIFFSFQNDPFFAKKKEKTLSAFVSKK